MIYKRKNVQTTPPAPTASAVGPCPTLIQISRMPRHWKFTQHHRTTRPPPAPIKAPYLFSQNNIIWTCMNSFLLHWKMCLFDIGSTFKGKNLLPTFKEKNLLLGSKFFPIKVGLMTPTKKRGKNCWVASPVSIPIHLYTVYWRFSAVALGSK